MVETDLLGQDNATLRKKVKEQAIDLSQISTVNLSILHEAKLLDGMSITQFINIKLRICVIQSAQRARVFRVQK